MTRRLVAASLALSGMILLLVAIPLGLTFEDGVRVQMLNEIERDARVLAALVEQELERDDLASVERIADRYAERSDGRIVVTDLDGIALVDTASGSAATNDFSDRPEVVAALDGSQASGIAPSAAFDEEFGYVAVPIFSGPTVLGAMRVSEPTSHMRAEVRTNWLVIAVVSAAILAAAGVGGWLIARWTVRPVQALEHGARRLAAGELGARMGDEHGPPELRRLAATFNEMAVRLELLISSQRAFVADASHQLRTPLTALHLRIESIEDRLGSTDPDIAALERDLDAVGSELERLTALVDRLLELARTEVVTGIESVDLGELVSEAAARWSPLAEAESLAIRATCPPGVRARAVVDAVPQILDNLIDNAITAAPAGSTVTVSAGGRTGDPEQGEFVTLRVQDRGPGLTDSQIERSTDRFWRAPDAAPGGTGLGLAIVSELAALSNGSLRLLHPPEGPGLIAEIRLPADP